MAANIISTTKMRGVGVEWGSHGPGSRLIFLTYLAFPLAKLSILQAFRGSRLSLSFGRKWAELKATLPQPYVNSFFSHTTISSLKPFGDAQWSGYMLIRECLAFLQSITIQMVSGWLFIPQAFVSASQWIYIQQIFGIEFWKYTVRFCRFYFDLLSSHNSTHVKSCLTESCNLMT